MATIPAVSSKELTNCSPLAGALHARTGATRPKGLPNDDGDLLGPDPTHSSGRRGRLAKKSCSKGTRRRRWMDLALH